MAECRDCGADVVWVMNRDELKTMMDSKPPLVYRSTNVRRDGLDVVRAVTEPGLYQRHKCPPGSSWS